jgi:Arc/MetJ-type ribon-helix-helix transcriptional regulator
VETGEFSSTSDFVSIAIMDFIKKLDARKDECPPKT